MIIEKIKINMDYKNVVNTFAQAGYDVHSALAELIDNSLGAGAKDIGIEVFRSKDSGVVSRVVIADDGNGILKSNLENLLGPATVKGNSLNEHGVGMKAAIAWFGGSNITKGLDYIESDDGTSHYKVVDLDNDASVVPLKPTGKSFTTISINVTPSHNITASQYYPYVNRIGRRYGHWIDAGVKITLNVVNESDDTDVIHECKIPSYHPPYLNPSTGAGTPIMTEKIKSAHHGYEVEIRIGKVDTSKVNKATAWKGITIGGGGVDIIMNNRVVMQQTRLPLDKCPKQSHPHYGPLIGQLRVIKGLNTTPKKNAIVVNAAFKDLQDKIGGLWTKNKMSPYFTASSGLNESVIRDNLAKMLKQEGYSEIGTEKSTYFGTKMDVVAKAAGSTDNTIFEVKADELNPNAINQLVGYMMADNVTAGVVVGNGISSNAEKFLELVKTVHPTYTIEVWNFKDTMKYQSLTSGA